MKSPMNASMVAKCHDRMAEQNNKAIIGDSRK